MKSALALFVSILLLASPLLAAVKLASPFGDHMVLQQSRPVPVWGTAAPGEKIAVEFAGQKATTTADTSGRWRVDLARLTASAESRRFTVSGSATPAPIELNDVLVGEVWLCGGQSNMERQLGLRPGQKPIVNWEQEVAAATHPLIRQFYVHQRSTLTPQTATEGAWTVCTPTTVADFTAVGYFFARDLHAARGVPVGIIHSSIGGTPAEAWTSREGLQAFPDMKDALDQISAVATDPVGARRNFQQQLDQWYRTNDAGSGEHPWSEPGLDVTDWETMQLPTLWEDAGHPGYDGIAWFRKSFDLPADWAGRDLNLRLCAVDDLDTTWVNGTEVGTTSGWDQPRTYLVSAALLKAAGNVIAVRVLDTGGGGGLWDKRQPFALAPADRPDKSLPLAGPWLAHFSHPVGSGPRPPQDVTTSYAAPSVLYNAMIAPLIPYAMGGVVFYQGEANAGRATQYRTLFPALITDWRQRWGQGDFPFLFVQIAPHKEMSPEIREAQLFVSQTVPNTAMAVTIDCGDAADIHPAHKQPVGARLALAAQALAYGEKLEYCGPVFAEMKVTDGRGTLRFTHTGGGLAAKDGSLVGFTIAGADGIFHPADATITGETVVVHSPAVAQPVAVRYGWANVAEGNLFGANGLPASPFRTDAN